MPLDEKTTSEFDGWYCIHCQNQQSDELASKEQVNGVFPHLPSNTAINALKFYYGEVLKRNFIYEIIRLRKWKDKKLPVV